MKKLKNNFENFENKFKYNIKDSKREFRKLIPFFRYKNFFSNTLLENDTFSCNFIRLYSTTNIEVSFAFYSIENENNVKEEFILVTVIGALYHSSKSYDYITFREQFRELIRDKNILELNVSSILEYFELIDTDSTKSLTTSLDFFEEKADFTSFKEFENLSKEMQLKNTELRDKELEINQKVKEYTAKLEEELNIKEKRKEIENLKNSINKKESNVHGYIAKFYEDNISYLYPLLKAYPFAQAIVKKFIYKGY